MICLGCGRTIAPGTVKCLYCGYAADRYALGAMASCSSGEAAVPVEIPPVPVARNEFVENTINRLRRPTLIIGEDDFVGVPPCSHTERRQPTVPRDNTGGRARHIVLCGALLGSGAVFGLVAWWIV